jgi:two-component system, chemotaxis family, protein-glutamate methylesterase/glutaminase
VPIRVLVVDDSAFMRRVISEAIAAEPDMEVAGVAINGLDALLKVERVQPDVVTLDVEMPEMDGLTALRHLMARYPRPVVMLSSLTQAGAVTTIRALTIGAVDFVAKPSGSISLDFHRVREELIQKVRVAATARVTRPAPLATRAAKPPVAAPAPHRAFDRLVVIGTSTGGPRALAAVMPDLPVDASTAYLVVQHMPAGFTRSLAERLNGLTRLAVREAAQGDRLGADDVLVAPGDYHLRLSRSGTVELDQGPRVHGVRPSVDVTLSSLAETFGPRAVVAILTGMGSDGAEGAAAVRAAGGYLVAEDESSCVVWGMPRAAVERAGADRVVPIGEVANAIAAALRPHAGRAARKAAG